MGYLQLFGREGSTYVNTFSSSGAYYDSNAGTQTVLFEIPNTSNSFYFGFNTEVTSFFYANDTNSSHSYSFISGEKAYSQTGPYLDPYSTPRTAFGKFTIAPAGYTGKADGLSSTTSSVLGISTSSTSYGSSSSYLEPTFAQVYQGGAQVYTCTTEGTYFAVPDGTGGFDYFNSFGVNALLVESTISQLTIGTSTVAVDPPFWTGTYNGLSYITTSAIVPISVPAGTNIIEFNSHLLLPATQIPEGIDVSEVRRNDMDARELFVFRANDDHYYSTFMDAPLLGQNIPVLVPHERTSYGYFSTYPIYTVPFGEYALNSNSMTFYSPTTTIGSGSDSSNTYSTQNSASYIINSNACNSSTYTTFISTDQGMTTGTLEIAFGGLLGVTSYTTGLYPASSSASYFNGMEANTALLWQAYAGEQGVYYEVTGTIDRWAGDYPFGDLAFGAIFYGYLDWPYKSFPKTAKLTIGSPNSNAYVAWGTQNLIAEFNGLLGAF